MRAACQNGYSAGIVEAGVSAPRETGCARALRARPDWFDALHLLGLIKLQSGKAGAALGLLAKQFAISGHTINLHLDLIGDYEHVVQTASDANLSKNSNQANVGLALALNF